MWPVCGKITGFYLMVAVLLAACGSGSGSGSTAPGQSVDDGDGGGSPLSLSVGDVSYISFSNSSASVSLNTGNTYELLVQSQATDAAAKTVTLSNLSSDTAKGLGLEYPLEADVAPDVTYTAQVRLESLLRDEERLLINVPWDGGASKSVSASKAAEGGSGDVSGALSVDDTDTFRVLSSLSDVTSYTTVTATVKCVNDTVAIYIDDEITSTNPSDLPQADIDTLCTQFKTALTTVVNVLGDFSDINSDGVAVALITPAVNRLGSSSGGIVTGFFYSGDLFARSGSIPASNAREIVYLVSPDSGGVYGTKISNAFAMSNFLPAVFPHEMQHLISYYQHTIARSGSAEKDWLNEALSHFIEDYVGYGRENYSRYDLFLASPQSYALVTSGSPSLAQRGAGYLFLRYLYEQSGKSTTFLNKLINTTSTSTANVEAAYPSSSADFNEFGEFLRRWAVALAYTDRGLTTNGKYIYEARTLNGTTGNYHGACMICTASDGRGTVLTGPTYGTYSAGTKYSIRATATRFLKFSSTPSSVTFTGGSGSTPAAVVLRTK